MKNGTPYYPGLEGISAAQTRLSRVDGQAGTLIIGGYPLEELAARATFLETVYLLWHGRLPSASQLTEFGRHMARYRTLPPAVIELLAAAAGRNLPAMAALRLAAGAIDLDQDVEQDKASLIVARFPTIVATYWRLQQQLLPIPPQPDLDHAANFLYMLSGTKPSTARILGLETYLNTVIDHGLNASTFAARVIIATGSDLVSAVTGAVGALKGPIHGGAPGPALDMVFAIGEAANAEPFIRAKLERGERLMGFGHRVYKVRDPRADVLAAAAADLFAADGDEDLYNLALQVEQTAVSLLAEYKPGRDLQTNVEFYTALLLHGLGLASTLFTPTFALSRVAGWIAHCREQQQYGRLIRPGATYIGDDNRQWRPIAQR